jgi:hypothetical protein
MDIAYNEKIYTAIDHADEQFVTSTSMGCADLRYVQSFHSLLLLMMLLSMPCPSMSMIIIEKQILVTTICRKCHCRNTETWESTLKSVPSCERSCISPCLTVIPYVSSSIIQLQLRDSYTHARAHGSFAGCPEEATNAFGEKPVRFCLAALRMLSGVLCQ